MENAHKRREECSSSRCRAREHCMRVLFYGYAQCFRSLSWGILVSSHTSPLSFGVIP
jgi:hypothetical protein